MIKLHKAMHKCRAMSAFDINAKFNHFCLSIELLKIELNVFYSFYIIK